MNAILDDLTPAKREVAIQNGPVLVIAGAGTGKTKTLTATVAHRIADCGMPANRALAVTFTNEVAAETTGRIRMLSATERRRIGRAPSTASASASCASSRRWQTCDCMATIKVGTPPS